jgi:vacuolar-type H+-ATPase subunit C/Vma6
MLRSKNMAEVYDILLNTDYSADLGRLSPEELDIVKLEQVFQQNLSKRLYATLQMASGRTKELLEEYSRRIEAENLKRLVRAIHGNQNLSEEQLIPVPRKYQTVNFNALLQCHTIREMAELLRETNYRNLAESLDAYEKLKNPLVIEAQLDKSVFNGIWKKLGKAPNKDKLKDLFGTEIDLRNLLNILSLKYTGAGQEIIEETVINIGYRIPRTLAQKLGGVPYQSIAELVSWPTYAKVVRTAADFANKGMLSEAENTFLGYIYFHVEKTAMRNPNDLVYVFAYLELCFREAKNMVTLTVGKQLKLDDAKIQNLLLL